MTLIIRNPERQMQIAQGTAVAAGLAPVAGALINHFKHRLLNYRPSQAHIDRARSFANRIANRVRSAFSRQATPVYRAPVAKGLRSYARYRFPVKYGRFRSYRRRRRY